MSKAQVLEDVLLLCMSDQWKKMAMVIACVSEKSGDDNITDDFIDKVIEAANKLINNGMIEARGDVSNIRHSEVRISRTKNPTSNT